MTAAEIKENVNRVCAAWNSGELADIDKAIAPEAVHHGLRPGPEPLRGPEPVKQIVAETRRAFPDLQIVVEDVLVDGDRAAWRLRVSGTQRGEFMGIAPTGRRFTSTHLHQGRFANGQLVEHWASVDQLGMMQQLGALPTRPPAQTTSVRG